MPTTLEFFKALFGGEEELETGYMLITNLKGANKFTKSLSEAVAYADELKETSDVYFGTGLYEKPRKKGHGDEIDILIRGFYCLDIDIAGPGHKKDNLPESQEEAMGLLTEAYHGVKPTAVVKSGGGIHVYFAFKEPVEFENQNEREIGKRMSVMFHRIAKSTFDRHNFGLDNVSNLNRILRVPGTINHKNGERKPVELLELNAEAQVNEDFIEELYTEDMEGTTRTRAASKNDGPNPYNLVIDYNANIPYPKLSALIDTNITFKGAFEMRKQVSKQKDPSLSDFQMIMANIMVNNGWSDQEVCDTLIMHRRENTENKADEKITRLSYYTVTIRAAHDQIAIKKTSIDELREEAAMINETETPEEKARVQEDCLEGLRVVLRANITSIKEFVGLNDGKCYEISVDGIPCKIEDIHKLCNMGYTTRKISEVTKIMISGIKKGEWLKIVQIMLAAAETVEIGLGMSDEDIVRDRIILYIKDAQLPMSEDSTNKDDAAVNALPFRHNGSTFIFMAGFREFLTRKNDPLPAKTLSMALRNLGHNPETMAFRVDGKKTTRYVYKLNPDQL